MFIYYLCTSFDLTHKIGNGYVCEDCQETVTSFLFVVEPSFRCREKKKRVILCVWFFFLGGDHTLGKCFAAATFDHIGHQRPRSTTKSEQRNLTVQLLACKCDCLAGLVLGKQKECGMARHLKDVAEFLAHIDVGVEGVNVLGGLERAGEMRS